MLAATNLNPLQPERNRGTAQNISPENLSACRHVPDHPGFRRRPAPFQLIILLALSPILAQAADSPTTLVPQPVYEHQPAPGQYEVSRQLPPDQPNAAPLFFAVVSRDWPAGLVPLFGVHKESQFDLRRRPRPGREPSSDPLFFARPMTNDIATSKLSGRWDCQSVDADGTRNDYGWDFALEGTNVAGRFDPDTDYRFAYVMGGGFVSNQFHVKVEYINQRFEIHGTWQEGGMTGTWKKVEESGSGHWQATRPRPFHEVSEENFRLVPLYEWLHRETGTRRYAIGDKGKGLDWIRNDTPLGRVWIAAPAPPPASTPDRAETSIP